MIDNETATGATQRQPRNIFEQTLYGLQRPCSGKAKIRPPR